MLGKEKLMDYIKNFGFGSKTGVDLNGESSGILFDVDKMGNVELATTSFGQGISVTPIQQVRAVSAVVNGGTLYQPYIVKNYIETETNTVVKSVTPTATRNVISKETSELVKYALESVVAKGSGHNAYIENYRVGGKTGTAQTVEDGTYSSSKYILSFIGFMPANDPQIVVYVAIQNAKNVTQYGGVVAAPVARNIFLSAIDILGIEEDPTGIPKEYTWLDTKYVTVPDVVGKSVDDAKTILKGFNIEYSGTGDSVVYQEPTAGTYAKEGGTIMLMLG
jgi:stage V sporulation protein D (sporulation-specific penicillin-binding protein)